MSDEACSGSGANHINEDYGSEFEFEPDVGEKRKARHDISYKQPPTKAVKPNRQSFHDQCAREQGIAGTRAFLALDAYTRHKKLINEYVLCYSGSTSKLRRNTDNYKTDHDIIRENHRFLWEDSDHANTWGEQLAKKYYDRLFKEYCLCDLSRYKDKKMGMRWRTEKEVILGKGQFFCGSVNCECKDGLNTWEVLFGYVEHGERKSALVKLRLCEKCSYKLNYGYKGKAVLKKQKSKKGKKETDIPAEGEVEELSGESEAAETNETVSGEIWKQPMKEEVEQSKEDAFEEFLEDLFL